MSPGKVNRENSGYLRLPTCDIDMMLVLEVPQQLIIPSSYGQSLVFYSVASPIYVKANRATPSKPTK